MATQSESEAAKAAEVDLRRCPDENEVGRIAIDAVVGLGRAVDLSQVGPLRASPERSAFSRTPTGSTVSIAWSYSSDVRASLWLQEAHSSSPRWECGVG